MVPRKESAVQTTAQVDRRFMQAQVLAASEIQVRLKSRRKASPGLKERHFQFFETNPRL